MVHAARTPARIASHPGADAGFGMLEVLLTASFVALAILGLASTTLAGHRLAQTEQARGVALQTTRALLERLRADEDWSGLYGRLWAKVDPQLVDAGATWPISDFYDDLEVPAMLGEVRVRLEVPAATPAGAAEGTPAILREDAPLPRFGLPYDLNGDGVVDNQSRAGDYRALPVVINLHWQPPGGIAQTLRTTVWLRGER
jgi:hypothetical protein